MRGALAHSAHLRCRAVGCNEVKDQDPEDSRFAGRFACEAFSIGDERGQPSGIGVRIR